MNTFEAEFAKIEEEYRSHPTDKLMEKINNENPPIVVFGYGAVGNLIAESLRQAQGNVVAFCDNFKVGISEKFHLPIISPQQLASNYRNAVVVVSVCDKFNDTIYRQTLDMGFSPENVFQRYSKYELYSLSDFMKYYDGYEWAYNFFEDEISKKIILQRLKSYLFYCEMAHSPFENQYFDQDVMRFSDHEVFADCGCYIGDTALKFIEKMDSKYAYIYGFEPDKANFERAKKNLETYKNVELINMGLWNQPGKMLFNSASSSSEVSNIGSESIEMTSLDSFFGNSDNHHLPTAIKMDIEGSEKEALLGAKNVVSTVHPKLEICVYHKPQDIFVLPQLINNYYSHYHFSLRHYTAGKNETVMYVL